MKKTRRELTERERFWLKNLKAVWHDKKRSLSIKSLDELSALCGWSSSTAGQYMRGYIPLNTDAKVKFAAALRVDPKVIDPDFFYGNLPEDEARLLQNYRDTPPEGRDTLLNVSEALSGRQTRRPTQD